MTQIHDLSALPDKKYFTIGEVSEFCDIKSHVLRYWEQEFPMLDPVKRKGNRRYYQRRDVQLILVISQLLYKEGYTILGARQKLAADMRAGFLSPDANYEPGSATTQLELDETEADSQAKPAPSLRAEYAALDPSPLQVSMPAVETVNETVDDGKRLQRLQLVQEAIALLQQAIELLEKKI